MKETTEQHLSKEALYESLVKEMQEGYDMLHFKWGFPLFQSCDNGEINLGEEIVSLMRKVARSKTNPYRFLYDNNPCYSPVHSIRYLVEAQLSRFFYKKNVKTGERFAISEDEAWKLRGKNTKHGKMIGNIIMDFVKKHPNTKSLRIFPSHSTRPDVEYDDIIIIEGWTGKKSEPNGDYDIVETCEVELIDKNDFQLIIRKTKYDD